MTKFLTHSDGTPCAGWECAWKDDGGHHVADAPGEADGSSTPDYWQRQLDLATERTVAAAEDSVKAAVLLLAYGARECLPEAKRINLSESDQGEWLWVDSIDSEIDDVPDDGGFQDGYGHAASCLYVAHLDASPYLHADLDDDGTDNGRYYIDIQEALA